MVKSFSCTVWISQRIRLVPEEGTLIVRVLENRGSWRVSEFMWPRSSSLKYALATSGPQSLTSVLQETREINRLMSILLAAGLVWAWGGGEVGRGWGWKVTARRYSGYFISSQPLLYSILLPESQWCGSGYYHIFSIMRLWPKASSSQG